MSLNKRFNDLIDLKDHCFLCYRLTEEAQKKVDRVDSVESETSHSSEEEHKDGGNFDVQNASENKQNEQEGNLSSSSSSSPSSLSAKSCKSFLKSISRYFRIPYALVNVAIKGDDEPKTIRKRWENLIKGEVCKKCKPTLDHFRDLFHKITYLELQMDLVAQDIEQAIYLADKKISSQAGKKVLEGKWEAEREIVNPKLNFTLLSILREHITSKASKKNKFPYVTLKRMQSPVGRDDHGRSEGDDDDDAHSYTTRPMAGPCQTHRPSLTDDSGFSTTTSENSLSPLCSLSVEETDRQDSSIVQQVDNGTTVSSDNNKKKHVVIRQVIRCRKCNKKIMKGRFQAHCQSNHPKPVGENSVRSDVTSNQPFSKENKEVTQDRKCSVTKKVIVCPKDQCTSRFLRKKSFLDHLGLCHRDLLSKFPTDSTTAAPKVVPDNNDKINTPTAEKVVASSPVVTSAPNLTTKPNYESAYKQGLVHKRVMGIPKQRPPTRGPYIKRKFSCASCPKKFHNKDELLLHAQKHRNHQCNFCNVVCKGPHATALHELHFHGDFTKKQHPIPFGCPRCGESFQNANTYKAHFWRLHLYSPSPSFKCRHCHETFGNVEVFKNHVSLKACKSPSTSSHLKSSDHIQKAGVTEEPQPGPSKKAKKEDFDCSICNLPCRSFFALRSHVVSHDPNIEPCSECLRFCKDQAHLEKHRNTFHSSAPVVAATPKPAPIPAPITVPIPVPVPTPAPESRLKLVIIRKFCKYCNKRKTFKSPREFEKHISKHEDKPKGRKRRGRRPGHFHDKQCPVCKQYFRNLGSHMKAHVTQSSQEEGSQPGETNRENNESENNKNNDTGFMEESEDDTSHNEPTGETEVDSEIISNINDEDESATRKSLADRVKLRQRRPSTLNATIPAELLSDNSEDEDDYIPRQRGRKRSCSKSRCSRGRNRISRIERNETKSDDDDESDDDSITKRKKSKPSNVEEAPAAPENEESINEEVNFENVDNVPQKENDNTRQPLVNINSTLPPRSESKVDKVSNKDDQCELERQTSVIINNSTLPPKKRPQPPSSVYDGQEDTDGSSCSTVLLSHNNRPQNTNSSDIQVSRSNILADGVTLQENETTPRKQVNSSFVGIKEESSDCVPSGNAKVRNWMETNNAVSASEKTQEGVAVDETKIIDETAADAIVDEKPVVKTVESFYHQVLNKRVHSFLNKVSILTGQPSTNIATQPATDITIKNPTDDVSNPAENINAPPSPEIITID